MKTRHLLLGALAAISAAPSAVAQRYVKELTFPAGADSITKIEMAGQLVANPQQKAWQQRSLTAFLHFGMNTFTDREWGDGKESPSLFNPDSLDTDQWVQALKNAGFSMVILTAKHHDGFCLWPTATTEHSVKNSPWRDGKGDVVADLRSSCDKYGMKLGLYLSPWDRNAECYGDSPRYNDMFVAQLTELLTNYGKIDEVWFDGACGEGPNGKKQVYDWLRFRDTMRRLQPEAVLAITGDDVRWVGNEGGKGRETEWSVTPLVPSIFSYSDSINSSLGIDAMSKDLGSRSLIARADKVYWWPSEVDVSIRPGWFWHEREHPHSVKRLAEIYLESVGRNSVLLLNVPPDRHGRIADEDVECLWKFRRWRNRNFRDNKAGIPGSKINTVVLKEDLDSGQRVESFDVLGLVDGKWQKITSGTTIGNKRILMFDPVTVDDLRLYVTSSRGEPHASITGAYDVAMPLEQVEYMPDYPAVAEAPVLSMVRSGKNPSYLFEFKNPQTFAGFVYTPSVDTGQGCMYRYSVMVSDDGREWTEVPVVGEFGNIAANPIPQQVVFDKPVSGRFFMVICGENTGRSFVPGIEEITLLAPRQG